MRESSASPPLRRLGIDLSLGIYVSVEDFTEFFPILDAVGIQVQKFLEGAGLRLALATFEITEGRFRDSAHLNDLHLGQSSASAQLLEAGSCVIVCHVVPNSTTTFP